MVITNNFFSHKTKILIGRIVDKLKCEKKQRVWKSKTQRITLGKTSRMDIK